MHFDQWFDTLQQKGWLDGDGRTAVTKICDIVGDNARDPSAPAVPSPEDIFDALCAYCRENFTYSGDAKTALSLGLKSQQLDCVKAAQLVVGVILYCTRADLTVENMYGFPVNGGLGRVITPPVMRPGIRIENNVTGGGGRMFFTGTHAVAKIQDDQFDLISGLRRHTIDYGRAVTGVYTDPNGWDYWCEIDDVRYTFTPTGERTAQGMPKFNVVPEIA
ncbi:MAG: hypothetical protein ABI877_10555 [Gemmatimonadaceae bacterium]